MLTKLPDYFLRSPTESHQNGGFFFGISYAKMRTTVRFNFELTECFFASLGSQAATIAERGILMRITDFLAMIADLNRNFWVMYEFGANRHGKRTEEVDHVQYIKLSGLHTAEITQPQLILETTPHQQTLHLWELSVLLRQHQLRRYMYVEYQDQQHPLFGFRVERNLVLLG